MAMEDPKNPLAKGGLQDTVAEICAEMRRGFDELQQLLHDNKTEFINVMNEEVERNREAARGISRQ